MKVNVAKTLRKAKMKNTRKIRKTDRNTVAVAAIDQRR